MNYNSKGWLLLVLAVSAFNVWVFCFVLSAVYWWAQAIFIALFLFNGLRFCLFWRDGE